MDKGHRQADKILAEMTDEMLKVFDKADRKIIKKVRNYLKKFEAEIKEHEQMVDDGEMTRKEFEQWYVNRVTTGREWEELRDELAEDYHEATVEAMAKAGAGLLFRGHDRTLVQERAGRAFCGGIQKIQRKGQNKPAKVSVQTGGEERSDGNIPRQELSWAEGLLRERQQGCTGQAGSDTGRSERECCQANRMSTSEKRHAAST